MDVDASLKIVGLSGRLQNTNFVIFGFGLSVAAIHLTSIAFTIDQSVEHYCKPPAGFTANQTTPLIDKDDRQVPDSCHMYGVRNGTLTENTTTCRNGWEYMAVTYGETSIVTDLDLVCDRGFLSGTLMSIHFAGVLVGSSLTGQAADMIGRRPVSMMTLLLTSVLGTAISFTWNFELILALRFLFGMVLPGNSLVGYVRVIEMATPKKRLLGHVLVQHFWTLGVMLVAPLAYLLPNWRHLQLATSLMCLPLVLLMWGFTYESLRWLVQKGRVETAEAILHRIANSKNIRHDRNILMSPPEVACLTLAEKTKTPEKSTPGNVKSINNSSMPTVESSKPEQVTTGDVTNEKDTHVSANGRPKKADPKYTVLDLFKTKVLIKHTSVIFFCWIVMNALYFGFIVYSTSLAGNKYLNFFLLALVEAPVYGIDFFIVRRFGRRRPLIIFFFAAAVACLLTAFLPVKTASGTNLTALLVVVAMFGKFYTTASFELTLLVGTEVFPTLLRNIATGSASTVGRISTLIAPFIVYLKEVKSFLPMTIFGSLSLVASGLVFLLPETKNIPLPETYEDATKLTKNRDQESAL